MNHDGPEQFGYAVAAVRLAQAAGVPPATPTDGAYLAFERGGWTCSLSPHPYDAQSMVVAIELVSADEAGDAVAPQALCRGLRAILQLNELLAHQTIWRLGIDSAGMLTVLGCFDLAHFDAQQTLGMIDDGLQRSASLVTIWRCVLRGDAGTDLDAAWQGRPLGSAFA